MAYCDDVTLMQSIRQVLAVRTPVVELHFSAPINASGRDRRELLDAVRASILSGIDLPR